MKFIDTSKYLGMPSELRKMATQINHIIRNHMAEIDATYSAGDEIGLSIWEPMSCIGYLPPPDNKWLIGWDADGFGPSYGYDVDTGDWFKRDSATGEDTLLGDFDDSGYSRVLAEFRCALLG